MKSVSTLHGVNTTDTTNSTMSRTPPKNSNKKHNFSKSKNKKASGQYSSPTSSHQNAGSSSSGGLESNSSSGKDKTHHKSYVGLNSKSIKCIWEQHDKTETEVSGEVYARLAEDATYKLWELANNLKTYARHSGGKVTVDLVNEVLKDCDVPPTIGAGSTGWHKIEYDGTYFFHFDEVLELRDEYLKDVKLTQCGPLKLSTNWWANKGATDDMKQFYFDLCSAIFRGNETAFEYAIHTTLINPYIGCIIKPILVKCLETLVSEYSDWELDRCLKFLSAIVYNFHTRDSDINEILIHLSQIMSHVLLGVVDLKIELEPPKQISCNDSEKHFPGQIKMEEEINFIAKELQEPGQMYHRMNIDDMRFEDFEDQIMRDDGFTGKMEPIDGNSFFFKIKQESSELPDTQSILKVEPIKSKEMVTEIKPDEEENDSQQFSTLKTVMCTDEYVDNVCRFLGVAADKWGYFESEIIFILSKRLDIFFANINVWTAAEFEWLRRCISGLIVLGDYAIREMIPYFHKIDPFILPDYLNCHFNQIGMFLRGKSDIFFYEYLQEVCGDGLQPFMVFYSKYLEKLARKKTKQTLEIYKITSKLILKSIPKPSIQQRQSYSVNDIFHCDQLMRKTDIKFNTNTQVTVKLEANQMGKVVQSIESLSKFNSKITICKRKLLKSLTNKKQNRNLLDFRCLSL